MAHRRYPKVPRASVEAGQRATTPTAPVLVNFVGMLTAEGEAVANWLNLIGTPLPKPPDRSLLTPAQCYLHGLSEDERAEVWTRYQASLREAVADV